jgi:two-component system, LytTR family, response regulator
MTQVKNESLLRTLIVDDEFRSRSSLRILLGHHFPQVQVIGEAETVTDAIHKAQTLLPDLVFLDIMLPDGSAFDFLEVVGGLPFQVIMVSAFPEYSLRAFQYAAVHYLLKPIDLRHLEAAIDRVAAKQLPANASATATPFSSGNLALPTMEGFKLVALQEIVHAEADGNYTIFHFLTNPKLMVTHSIGHYEEQLADKGFYRLHHKYLVNLQHVKGYHRGRGGFVDLANGKSIEVSARKRDGFLEQLGMRRGDRP